MARSRHGLHPGNARTGIHALTFHESCAFISERRKLRRSGDKGQTNNFDRGEQRPWRLAPARPSLAGRSIGHGRSRPALTFHESRFDQASAPKSSAGGDRPSLPVAGRFHDL